MIEDKDLQSYIRTSKSNYPRLQNIVSQLSLQFEIEEPAAYIHTGNNHYGAAWKDSHSIIIPEDIYNHFSDGELKALAAHEFKHLYQGNIIIPILCYHRHEYDSDRASVDATNLATSLSLRQKQTWITINRWEDSAAKEQALQDFEDDPNFKLKESWANKFRRALTYPSHENREQAMEDHWQSKIKNESQVKEGSLGSIIK